MQNKPSYTQRIISLKKSVKIIADQNFMAARNGTHHKVFVSDKFVIRFRDGQPETLANESSLLRSLNHSLMPKVVWSGESEGFAAMVQEKLPGESLDKIWAGLAAEKQKQIVDELVEFLSHIRTIKSKDSGFYAVASGKSFSKYIELLTDGIERDVTAIKKVALARDLLSALLKIVEDPTLQSLFNVREAKLVHGDLIIHNLLSDGQHLTGVLDWELAFYGDVDYDLARLMYYQECARAYPSSQKDCEPDFIKQFLLAANRGNLIVDVDKLNQKYIYYRALFILRALKWAVQSNNPKTNIKELIELHKKRGLGFLA